MLGTSQNYVSLMYKYPERLLDYGDCFLLDARNHGRSGHFSSMTYDDLADDIVTILNELKVEKLNLIGHSMSGKTIMNLLLRESQKKNVELLSKINKVVIVDVSPVDYTKDERWVIQSHISAMKRIDLKSIKTRYYRQDIELELLVDRLPKDHHTL